MSKWEKIFVHNTSDKGLISQNITKQLTTPNKYEARKLTVS